MKVWAKVALGVLGVVLAGTMLALFGLWAIARDMCGNEILAELPAPDNRHRAVVFQRDCGATTGFSTQVSVLRGSRSLPNDGGNVFIADTDHGRAPAGSRGGPVVDVRWIDNAQLEIGHDIRARVFTADSLVEGVKIRFVTITPPGA
jgi:hypothetical protein